jgi:acetyltransferase-like isoleucine patch superfamily enzyme
MSDFARKIFLFKELLNKISNQLMNVKLISFGLKYLKKKLFDQTFIYKAKNSTIKLVNKLTFRFYPNLKLIDINWYCSISTVIPNAQIIIGDGCGFSGTVIGSFTKIELGKNVMCGANTLITDSDWHLDDPRAGVSKPVFIDDNVWLGVNVTVLKGVTIGKNSVIGAGSVVTKDIPANVIAGGNPCVIIKNID